MKEKKIIILSSVILGVLVLTLGVTFAVFTFNKTSSNSKLVVGDIYMHYKEANDGITLTNQMPFKEEYIVNPIMKTQSDTRNELMKCIEYFIYYYFEDGSTAESFCRGTGKSDSGETFQELYDGGEYFLEDAIQYFQDNNIITSDNKVNPIMQTQSDTRNELTKCIGYFSYYEYAKGSTVESFCRGTGKSESVDGKTLQEAIDSGTFIPNEMIQQLKNNNIITSDNKVNSIMQTQSDTRNELMKCIVLANGIIMGFSPDIVHLTDTTTYESFCKGTGKMQNGETVMTFQEAYNNNLLADYDTPLKDDNIIVFSTKTLPYFEFTIDGKNTYEKNDIWYDLVLSYGDQPDDKTTRIKDNLLKFRLTEIVDGVETEIFTDKSYDDLTNKRIHVETIPKNTLTEIKHTYRLYMWISSDIKICSGELTTGCDYYVNGTTPNWSDVFASIKVGATGDFTEKSLSTDASCFATSTLADGTLSINNYLKYNFSSSPEYQNPLCGSDVVIPSEIDGKKVTIIGEYFSNSKGLTNVIIPDSVTKIGNSAFSDNQLTSVTIGNNVTSIGSSAFSDNQLTNLVIPNSVKRIGSSAFSDNQLTSVTIPNSVTSIEYSAFNNNLLPDDQSIIYKRTDDNNDGIAEIDTTIIISYGGANKNVVIPDDVKKIGNLAFVSNQLTSVTIPNSVTTIGESAFSYNQLTNVTIGSDIIYIDYRAFHKDSLSNPNLKSITINKTCSNIKKIPDSKTRSPKYYPWLGYVSPYTASGVTIYGLNGEVCDSY